MTNFNISHSAISHSVKIFKEKMINDKEVKNQFEKFKAGMHFTPVLSRYPIENNRFLTFYVHSTIIGKNTN